MDHDAKSADWINHDDGIWVVSVMDRNDVDWIDRDDGKDVRWRPIMMVRMMQITLW